MENTIKKLRETIDFLKEERVELEKIVDEAEELVASRKEAYSDALDDRYEAYRVLDELDTKIDEFQYDLEEQEAGELKKTNA